MSLSKAQKIVNEVNAELGIDLAAYQNSELEYLKEKLERFLDLEIETDELSDPEDLLLDDLEDLDEEE